MDVVGDSFADWKSSSTRFVTTDSDLPEQSGLDGISDVTMSCTQGVWQLVPVERKKRFTETPVEHSRPIHLGKIRRRLEEESFF